MEEGHSGSSDSLTCSHCWGLPAVHPPCNPWVLYGIPGLLMGAGYPENPGEADHVPQGVARLGPCSGPMVWWWMVWGHGYDGAGMWGMM